MDLNIKTEQLNKEATISQYELQNGSFLHSFDSSNPKL